MSWLGDFRWAMNVMRARRWRRELEFSERLAFDKAFRPHLRQPYPDERDLVIEYPDAFYHAGIDDLCRAMVRSKQAEPERG